MTTTAPFDAIGAILSVHAMVSRFLIQAVEDVPESRMVEQPSGIANHPAWTLSHLNAYAGLLLTMLDDPGAPATDAEMARFGYGTTPIAELAAYATKRELLDLFTDRNARLAAVVAQKHSDFFSRPSPEKFRPHASTIGHLAVIMLVAHPSHHLGQLKQWRCVAGLAKTQ